MRKVIVNSTPLIVLCGIGRLSILRELYQEIFIPEAVYREVTVKEDTACIQIKASREWIHVEVEVMILSQEKGADLLILDDNAAKKTAKYLGFSVTGTLGVLLKAKRQGLIHEIRPLLSEMQQNGFYVSAIVEEMALKQAGELLPGNKTEQNQ